MIHQQIQQELEYLDPYEERILRAVFEIWQKGKSAHVQIWNNPVHLRERTVEIASATVPHPMMAPSLPYETRLPSAKPPLI